MTSCVVSTRALPSAGAAGGGPAARAAAAPWNSVGVPAGAEGGAGRGRPVQPALGAAAGQGRQQFSQSASPRAGERHCVSNGHRTEVVKPPSMWLPFGNEEPDTPSCRGEELLGVCQVSNCGSATCAPAEGPLLPSLAKKSWRNRCFPGQVAWPSAQRRVRSHSLSGACARGRKHFRSRSSRSRQRVSRPLWQAPRASSPLPAASPSPLTDQVRGRSCASRCVLTECASRTCGVPSRFALFCFQPRCTAAFKKAVSGGLQV